MYLLVCLLVPLRKILYEIKHVHTTITNVLLLLVCGKRQKGKELSEVQHLLDI